MGEIEDTPTETYQSLQRAGPPLDRDGATATRSWEPDHRCCLEGWEGGKQGTSDPLRLRELEHFRVVLVVS